MSNVKRNENHRVSFVVDARVVEITVFILGRTRDVFVANGIITN